LPFGSGRHAQRSRKPVPPQISATTSFNVVLSTDCTDLHRFWMVGIRSNMRNGPIKITENRRRLAEVSKTRHE
jgi:hypothetical protein